MTDHLENLLEGIAKEGQVESIGTFRLDPSKAWEKLAAFSLPFEAAWVVKLVQCAARSKSSLKVQQTHDETAFTFGPGAAWTHVQVESAMLSLSKEDPALTHLATALRALAAMVKLPFMLEYPDGSKAQWSNERLEIRDTRGGNHRTPLVLRVRHLALEEDPVGVRLLHTARDRTATIAKALTSHAQWCPVTVTLDGRVLSSVLEDSEFGVSNHHQPMAILHVPSRPDMPSLRVRAPLTAWEVSGSPLGTPIVSPDPDVLERTLSKMQKPCLAVALVSAFLRPHDGSPDRRSKSKLVWVKDGAEVARETLPLGNRSVAILVVCSADGLDTDISGLVPRESSRKDEVRAVVLKAVSEIFPGADGYQEHRPSRVPALACLLLGALGLLVSPPVGMAALGLGGLRMLSNRSQPDEVREQLKADFEELGARLWESGQRIAEKGASDD